MQSGLENNPAAGRLPGLLIVRRREYLCRGFGTIHRRGSSAKSADTVQLRVHVCAFIALKRRLDAPDVFILGTRVKTSSSGGVRTPGRIRGSRLSAKLETRKRGGGRGRDGRKTARAKKKFVRRIRASSSRDSTTIFRLFARPNWQELKIAFRQ